VCLLKELEANGILRHEGNLAVWDLDQLKQLSFGKGQSRDWSSFGSRFDVWELLKDEVGVSAADYSRRLEGIQLRPRKIFYYPASLKEAVDPQVIRADDSYLGPWDIGDARKMVHWEREVELPDGQPIGLNELFLARTVFYDFQGRRDQETGKLMVDEDGKERVFTAKWFVEKTGISMGQKGRDRGGNLSITSPQEFLIKRCPHLLASGLIKPADFRLIHQNSGLLVRGEKKILSNGQVYINGAKYNLGSEFDTRKRPAERDRYRVIELSRNLAGLVELQPDGSLRVTHTFKLKSEAEKKNRRGEVEEKLAGRQIKGTSTITSYISFGRDEVEVLPYRVTGENKRFTDESAEDYAERMRAISSFDFIQKISQRLSFGAHIGIHDALSWREQQWLATAANEIRGSMDKIVEQSKRYGADFLRTFLACEHGMDNGRKIITLAENLDPDTGQQVFSEYTTMVDTAESQAAEVCHLYSEIFFSKSLDPDEIQNAILR
jgi:hypothetical protein